MVPLVPSSANLPENLPQDIEAQSSWATQQSEKKRKKKRLGQEFTESEKAEDLNRPDPHPVLILPFTNHEDACF